ncbi:TM1812 family CRISPR-associated protein [Shewanella fidelis]|uniref:TM1812 family CRISPR-associated protein n=1 Tax=Shewanella fidelis TaxID=173509 RepID=UPI0004909B26|nr:TM1812 family CRISPR-associated protein [Shewanella fidelis]
MDWMQFTIALIDKLIWPLVVVFAVVSLKRPLAKLIPLAKKLKFKDLELEFGQGLKAVTAQAEGVFPELKTDKKALLIASANNLPNSAVLETWEQVDLAAERLIKLHCDNITLDKNTRYKHIENILISEALINTKQGKLFSELRQLRNRVAHAVNYEVGKAEAIQYIELCFKLIDHLNSLTPSETGSCHVQVKGIAS